MKEEVQKWMNKAESDLSASRKSIESKEFEWAGFQIQQAVEKSLKSVLIFKEDKLFKTHDLIVLGKEAGLPMDLIEYCEDLSKLYLHSRYPDVVDIENLSKKIKVYLGWAEEILKWSKKQI